MKCEVLCFCVFVAIPITIGSLIKLINSKNDLTEIELEILNNTFHNVTI